MMMSVIINDDGDDDYDDDDKISIIYLLGSLNLMMNTYRDMLPSLGELS
jgi:hypothetical protein